MLTEHLKYKSSITVKYENQIFETGTILKKKKHLMGHRGGSSFECLPLTQGVIPESQDRVPRRAPCIEPASPSACVSYEYINKIFFKNKIKIKNTWKYNHYSQSDTEK